MWRIVSLAALLALLLPVGAEAQFSAGNDPFTVSVSPVSPAPYNSVTLTPIAGQVDITSALMTVATGKTRLYSGNAQSVAVALGAPGATLHLVVSMKTSGGTYTQQVSITPQDVTAVVEPLSSAPPLYPGKPLVPLGGSVRVVVLADLRTTSGKRLDPTGLVYNWSVDGVQSASASGIGKRAVIIDSPLQYRDRTVDVTVASADGTLTGGTSLDLVASEPTMRIYAHDPLLGVLFDHALGSSYTLSGSEATLYATPFSFPTALGSPVLQWFVNGASAQTGNLITLRPSGQGTGAASLSVTGSAGDVAAATAALSLTFGAPANTNLFGL